MSGTLVSQQGPTPLGFPAAGSAPQSWGPPPANEASLGQQLGRVVAAVRRYKWLVLSVAILGSGAGVAVSRLLPKSYEVKATIFITQGNENNGPIRAKELLDTRAWTDLLRSFAILDSVVSKQSLYLRPKGPADAAALKSLRPGANLRPGSYTLHVSTDGARYVLDYKWEDQEYQIERGSVGDSVGRKMGLLWRPTAKELGRDRAIRFDVMSPREASVELNKQLDAALADDRSNFLNVTLRGDNPQQIASTMNTLLDEFVAASARLKRQNLTEFANTLDSQRTYALDKLRRADQALEQFRVNTITLPSENAPVAAGVAETRDPVFRNFFDLKVEYDNVHRDREALEALLGDAQKTRLSADALMSVPGVLSTSEGLKDAMQELSKKQAQLRAARLLYTDEHRVVKDLKEQIDVLEGQTIPSIASLALDQLRRRESELARRIGGASRELKEIPTRTIEEMRLRREVDVASTLYTTLQSRYQEARLAEASAIPDVSVLDRGVAPQTPTRNQAPRIIALAAVLSVGFGLGLAVLLDRVDRRFRYPEQATDELGLEIIGAVPTIRRRKGGRPTMEETSEIIEAFRSLRLNIRSAFASDSPVMLTVSSPGAGDGKSLLSSNLALAFAEAGYRTVLVDGDIRRGTLHTMFGVAQRPGLIDLLSGDATRESVFRETTHPNLALVAGGSRRHRGPELLASDAMARFVRELGTEYDAVIVDSAPLGAGIDPFALGAATGNLLLVLRAGSTDRKVAQAKLLMLERLPIRLLGAVLNDFRSATLYKYYAYLDGYGTLNDDEAPKVLEGGMRSA